MRYPEIRVFYLALCICAALSGATSSCRAEGQGVIAIANDQPITELDITERISLMNILGDAPAGGLARKAVLQLLVDDVVKLAEAKRLKLEPTDAEITKRIAQIAKGMNISADDLISKLTKQGVSTPGFRNYITTQIGFNRIISGKYRDDITVQPADIDRKFADIQQKVNSRMGEIMKDPRMQGIMVYTLMEILLPVEDNSAMASELLQARAVEANQVAKQFKGCSSARAAAEGIFDVKFGKPVEADSTKLPPPLKAALDKAGPGKVIGPMRAKGGIQLLAFCSSRKIVPPKPNFQMPTRQQVENSLINEKYGVLEETYLKTARKSVYIEYRDPSYSQ